MVNSATGIGLLARHIFAYALYLVTGVVFLIAIGLSAFASPIKPTDDEALFKLRYGSLPMVDASAVDEYITGDIQDEFETGDITPHRSTRVVELLAHPCSDEAEFLAETPEGGEAFYWVPIQAGSVTATTPSGEVVTERSLASQAGLSGDCWGVVERGEMTDDIETADIETTEDIETADTSSPTSSLGTPFGFIPSFPTTSYSYIVAQNDPGCVLTVGSSGVIVCVDTTSSSSSTSSSTSSGSSTSTSTSSTSSSSGSSTTSTSSTTSSSSTSTSSGIIPVPTTSGSTSTSSTSSGTIPPTTSGVVNVSEPAFLFFLGIGLLGLLFIRKKPAVETTDLP